MQSDIPKGGLLHGNVWPIQWLVNPTAQTAQDAADVSQGNWLGNGSQDRLAAFNQVEMKQKETFIMLCRGRVSQDIKKASLILMSFLVCQDFAEMSFHGA